MDNNLKLYVWKGVLTDYTSGIMFALARNVKEARELALKDAGGGPHAESDLKQRPKVYHSPVGFAVWGGG